MTGSTSSTRSRSSRAGQPEPAPIGEIARTRRRGFGLAWIAAVAVLVLVLAASMAGVGGPAPLSSVAASLEPTASSASTASPSPSLEIENGLPVAIDGVPVLIGQAAIDAIAKSTDASPILVGGWIHAPQVMSCPAMRTPSPWNPCWETRLFPSPFDGPVALRIVLIAPNLTLPSVADGFVEPVVLRVHTHEPTCDGAFCAGIPVLNNVAWTGPVQPVSAPTNTRPPTGFGEAAAIEAAIRVVSHGMSAGVTVTSAVAGPYAKVAPGGAGIAGDRWVWVVTVVGTFPAPDCFPGAPACLSSSSKLVILDFVDGTFLMSEARVSSAVPSPSGDGMGALNVASKFEIARAAGQWNEAWAVLAPFSQARIGSLDKFIEIETAYNAAGGGFTIDNVVSGAFDDTTKAYIGQAALDDFARAGEDPSQAFLVYLTHPDEPGASAGSSAYLIAPVTDGWRIWIVH